MTCKNAAAILKPHIAPELNEQRRDSRRTISLFARPHFPIISQTTQVDHSIPFDLCSIKNQNRSTGIISLISDKRNFGFKVAQVQFAFADSEASDLSLEMHGALIFANVSNDEMRLMGWRKSRWSKMN